MIIEETPEVGALRATPEEEALCLRPEGGDLVPVFASSAAERGTVQGGPVRSYVQAAVDEINEATGETSFGTYPGHSPSPELAVDCFVQNRTTALGNAMCQFALDNWERLAFDYMIFRQRIFNPEIANYWRDMSDRGSDTQNHFDHVHFSWETSGSATPDPKPTAPPPEEEEPTMLMYKMGPNVWLARSGGPPTYIPLPSIVDVYLAAKVRLVEGNNDFHEYQIGSADKKSARSRALANPTEEIDGVEYPLTGG